MSSEKFVQKEYFEEDDSMEMMKYKLGNIAKTGSGGTPKSTVAEYYEGGNIPWINSGELNAPFITSTSNYITEKGYENSSAKLFPPQTVLLAMYGATAGKASLLEFEACTNQAICAIMPNEDILSPLYLKYKLDTMYNYLVGLSTGSARDNLSQDGIKALELNIPSLLEQDKITDVLHTLDKKIALNQRINRNLEELARLIYDYWFVQFDFPDKNGKPYKTSRGKMVYNDQLKREIPAGWEVKPLKECIKHINTGLNPRDNFVLGNGNIKYVTVKNLTTEGNIDFSGCDFIDEDALKKVHKRSDIAKGDVLYASICPLGRSYLINKNPEGWDINESVFSIRPNLDIISSEFLSMLLKDPRVVEKASKMATGSIFKGIRIKELENIVLAVPSKDVIDAFSKQIGILIELEHKNTEQITSLTSLRDRLLPLLMNGQVSVEKQP